MLHGNSTDKEAICMFNKGRDEEAATMIYKHTRVGELALLRVLEKLYVLLIQEPKILVGVEEQVQRIQRKLISARYDLTEESLMDIAYDFEDVIDDLLIRSAAKQRRKGHWKRWILLIRIHKKLELIKSKISTLLLVVPVVQCSMEVPEDLEEMEWSPMFSIYGQKLANRVVSPVEEKVLALRALKALHPDARRKPDGY